MKRNILGFITTACISLLLCSLTGAEEQSSSFFYEPTSLLSCPKDQLIVHKLQKQKALRQTLLERYDELIDLDYEKIPDTLSEEAASLVQGDTLKLKLKNGLSVYLISNPKVLESGAAIAVEAGSWDDPADYPGMAHFVEHLLFLGTQAYPREMEYSQYIYERGGECNAFTAHDRTIYGFSVAHESFEGALSRLAHFFIDPLFDASAIEREANAVHHEFEDSIENDSLRVWRVLKETGSKKHPNAVFSCGNLHSLSNLTPEEVSRWFEAHYKPSHMHLVLFSPLPLTRQLQLVHRYFSSIPEREAHKIDKEHYEGSILSKKQKGHYLYVAPSFKGRSLMLLWEIPKVFLMQENAHAMQLLQMALDHYGENSLSRLLEREGLATEMHIDFWKVEKDHALFMLDISLTQEGVKQHELVVERCFEALNALKEMGLPSYLFDQLFYQEKKQVQRYASQKVFDYVMRASSELIDEDIQTYPEKTYIPNRSALPSATDLLTKLTPENCVYLVLASPHETGIKLSYIEKWMGTEYWIRTISHEKILQWTYASPHPEIGVLPPEYYEQRRNEIAESEYGDPYENIPESLCIIENPSTRIRLIEDSSEEEEINAFFCFSSPSFGGSLKNVALHMLFIQGVQQELKKAFPFKEDLYWNVEADAEELCLFLNFNKTNAVDSLEKFFSVLKRIEISEQDFLELKQHFLDDYTGDPDPLEYAHQILDSLMMHNIYTKMELYHFIPSLTCEDLLEFRQHYFNCLHVEGAFLGNLDSERATGLWKVIETLLDASPYCVEDIETARRGFSFPSEAGPCFILQKTHRKGNALILMLHAGEASLENWASQKVLTTLLQQEFFEELRTKQQTAYILYNWQEMMPDSICQCLALQSSTHHPYDLLSRVESFLKIFLQESRNKISLERFERVKRTLEQSIIKQIQHIEKQEDKEAALKSIEGIKHLSYSDFMNILPSVFSYENQKRIAVMILGKDHTENLSEEFFTLPYRPIEREHFNRSEESQF